MSTYITHFFTERLPEKGYKQLSFLTSNLEDIKKKTFYYGYDGSMPLTEEALSLEIEEGKIQKLDAPLQTDGIEKFLWIDSNGNIWCSDDILLNENKKLIGPSYIKLKSQSYIDEVYKEKIQPIIKSGIGRMINIIIKSKTHHPQLVRTLKQKQSRKLA